MSAMLTHLIYHFLRYDEGIAVVFFNIVIKHINILVGNGNDVYLNLSIQSSDSLS